MQTAIGNSYRGKARRARRDRPVSLAHKVRKAVRDHKERQGPSAHKARRDRREMWAHKVRKERPDRLELKEFKGPKARLDLRV